jgi:hypothetical protein
MTGRINTANDIAIAFIDVTMTERRLALNELSFQNKPTLSRV